jgi:hypothetical protein
MKTPLTLRGTGPLLIALLVAPLAACTVCDDGRWRSGGDQASGTAGDDWSWPAPTPPSTGYAGAGGASDGGITRSGNATAGSAGTAGTAGTSGAAGHGGAGGTSTSTGGSGGASSGGSGGAAGGGGSSGGTNASSAGSSGSGGAGASAGGGAGGSSSGAGGACVCDNGVTTHPPVCQFDNQCGSGRCRNGACERSCTSSTTCGTGLICTAGFCQAPSGAGGQCLYDKDCGADASCINGFCHARCTGDPGCGAADRCVDAVCQPDVGPQPQCRGNAECPKGQECINAICRTPCGADADCCAGSSGPYCRGGVCVTTHEAAPMCKIANDCGLGQSCLDAACS